MLNRRVDTDLFGAKEQSINSKVKGNNNELKAAKWLTKWTGCPFTRTPSSGGLRWKHTANVCGDVVCEVHDFFFPFIVETKHLKSIYITKKLRSNSELFTIFHQACEDAERGNKHPMALLRANWMKAETYYIVLPYWIGEWVGISCKCVSKGTMEFRGNTIELFVFDSEDFAEKIVYQNIVEFIKMYRK